MAKRNIKNSVMRNGNTGTVSIILLTCALGCFLAFNYFTTFDTFTTMLGNSTPVKLLVIAISLVDLGGFTRVITKEDKLTSEGFIVWVTFFVWIMAAIVDVVFTAWWVILTMNIQNIPGEHETMLNAFPWAVAVIEFCIRIPLVLVLGKILDQKISGKGLPSFQANKQSFQPSRSQSTRQPQKVKASYNAVPLSVLEKTTEL